MHGHGGTTVNEILEQNWALPRKGLPIYIPVVLLERFILWNHRASVTTLITLEKKHFLPINASLGLE